MPLPSFKHDETVAHRLVITTVMGVIFMLFFFLANSPDSSVRQGRLMEDNPAPLRVPMTCNTESCLQDKRLRMFQQNVEQPGAVKPLYTQNTQHTDNANVAGSEASWLGMDGDNPPMNQPSLEEYEWNEQAVSNSNENNESRSPSIRSRAVSGRERPRQTKGKGNRVKNPQYGGNYNKQYTKYNKKRNSRSRYQNVKNTNTDNYQGYPEEPEYHTGEYTEPGYGSHHEGYPEHEGYGYEREYHEEQNNNDYSRPIREGNYRQHYR